MIQAPCSSPRLYANQYYSVHYEMPRSTHIHKSMLLRGVEFGSPALDRGDIEATKGRANRSGRSYGGAPLRGDHSNGRGRGSQMSYADSRPNPFAAHINPNFSHQGNPNSHRGGPPPPPMGSWSPPPAGLESSWRGPPPPPPPGYGGPSYGYAPSGQVANYGRPPPHQPPNNNHDSYYNGNSNVGNQLQGHQGYYAPPSNGRYGGRGDWNGR